jgi:hypothetical protein
MEASLLNRYDRSAPMNGEAEVKFLDGDFRVVKPGAFVRCAVTGQAIPLERITNTDSEAIAPEPRRSSSDRGLRSGCV